MNPTQNEHYPPVVMPSLEQQVVLTGQKALVTGASSGIGKQVAIALGHAGADVVVNYVTDSDKAEEAVQEIKRRCGIEAMALQADVSKEDEVQAMFRTLCKEFGTLDILVNNAGLQKDAPFEEMTLAQWRQRRCGNSSAAAWCRRCPAPRARSSA